MKKLEALLILLEDRDNETTKMLKASFVLYAEAAGWLNHNIIRVEDRELFFHQLYLGHLDQIEEFAIPKTVNK